MTSTTPSTLLVFLVLVTGATYRLTRLAIRDTITAKPRAWLLLRFTGPLVNTFTRCYWCVSVWISAGVTAAAWAWWVRIPWLPAVLIALTAAAIVGFTSDKEG